MFRLQKHRKSSEPSPDSTRPKSGPDQQRLTGSDTTGRDKWVKVTVVEESSSDDDLPQEEDDGVARAIQDFAKAIRDFGGIVELVYGIPAQTKGDAVQAMNKAVWEFNKVTRRSSRALERVNDAVQKSTDRNGLADAKIGADDYVKVKSQALTHETSGPRSTKKHSASEVEDLRDGQAKRPKIAPALVIVEKNEEWEEKDDDEWVFDKTKIVLQDGDGVFYTAATDKSLADTESMAVADIEALERVRIPLGDYQPKAEEGLHRFAEPLSDTIYVKRPRLISWQPEGDNSGIAALVLQEARVCETIRSNPHPNVARYYGCLVQDDRITGLCFNKYSMNLQAWLAAKGENLCEEEKRGCLQGIEDGIRHLHHLGLAHNDINPSNIMMDNDRPVLIDFDSMVRIGEPLGLKAGTPEWELEGAELSAPENDFYGLQRIREVTLGAGSPGHGKAEE